MYKKTIKVVKDLFIKIVIILRKRYVIVDSEGRRVVITYNYLERSSHRHLELYSSESFKEYKKYENSFELSYGFNEQLKGKTGIILSISNSPDLFLFAIKHILLRRR